MGRGLQHERRGAFAEREAAAVGGEGPAGRARGVVAAPSCARTRIACQRAEDAGRQQRLAAADDGRQSRRPARIAVIASPIATAAEAQAAGIAEGRAAGAPAQRELGHRARSASP